LTTTVSTPDAGQADIPVDALHRREIGSGMGQKIVRPPRLGKAFRGKEFSPKKRLVDDFGPAPERGIETRQFV